MLKVNQKSKKDLTTAVKAAYKLGIIEGKDQIEKKFKTEIEQLIISNNQMRIINKSLVEVMKDADAAEFGTKDSKGVWGGRHIQLTQTYTRQIIKALKLTGKYKGLIKNIILAFERDVQIKFNTITCKRSYGKANLRKKKEKV